MEPIPYLHEGKERLYYPDFILNDYEIIEIKHLGFIFDKKRSEIEQKKVFLEEFCEKSKKFSTKFITNEDIPKRYVKIAKKIHNESN